MPGTAAGLAIDVAELQTGFANRRIINDRQKVRRVGHYRPIEQRLVVLEQIDQIDVTLEVGGLGAELHPHPVQLDVHALGDVGRQADDAARLLFRFGESGGLVERRIVEKVYAALGRSAVAT